MAQTGKQTSTSRKVNILTAILMGLFLLGMGGTALMSGHAWTLTCYYCKQCNRDCPQGIDAASLVTAALADNPDSPVLVSAGYVAPKPFYDRTPNLPVLYDEKVTRLGDIPPDKIGQDDYFEIPEKKLTAVEAAFVCSLCPDPAPCQDRCPIKLPVRELAKDLQDDGLFNGSVVEEGEGRYLVNGFTVVALPLMAVPLLLILLLIRRQSSASVLCMECQQCLVNCPVMKKDPEFLGPMGLMASAKKNPRGEEAEKLRAALEKCIRCVNCREACPRGLHAADIVDSFGKRFADADEEAES